MAMKPIKVSQLNSYIKRILQTDPLLGNVSVIGEISNLKFHSSGHVYFSMKDAGSKINCFLPSDVFKKLHYELSEGMEITASGYIYVYEKGGTYSLNIRDVQVEGLGNLSIAFEKLKERLASEGLFDEKYKKPIPTFPRKIAVLTSGTGAAVQDILKIITSRNDIADVLVYPCLVQGNGAAEDIAGAIEKVNLLFPETDVIIVGRGGGSMEELWAFNEEIVARSIFASKIPVISAVGHETDFTIADFVADRRAETPTAAAQMAVPNVFELRQYVASLKEGLDRGMDSMILHKEQILKGYDPNALISGFESKIEISLMKSRQLFTEMEVLLGKKIIECENNINSLKKSLDELNPMNIMERGYAAVLDKNGRMLSSLSGVNSGDSLTVVMPDGSADCEVKDVRREA